MHIGILAGSFNPAHIGHLHISKQAIKKLGLNKIWWVLTPKNPLKKKKSLWKLKKRERLARNLIDQKNIQLKILENPKDKNFSYKLINNILRKNPHAKFYWLMGADNLRNFQKWRRWNFIANRINIIIFPRNNELRHGMHSKFAIRYRKNLTKFQNIKKKKPPFWTILPIRKIDISASQIRLKKKLF